MLDKVVQNKIYKLKKEPYKKLEIADYYGPDDPDAFHMPGNEKDVIFIDSSLKVDLAAPLYNEKFIGIDTEWRPNLCLGHTSKTSIL